MHNANLQHEKWDEKTIMLHKFNKESRSSMLLNTLLCKGMHPRSETVRAHRLTSHLEG